MKSMIGDLKNSTEELSSRVTNSSWGKDQWRSMKWNEQHRELWDERKRNNKNYRSPWSTGRQIWWRNNKEILDKNSSRLRNRGYYIQEAQRVPAKTSSNRKTWRHSVLRTQKTKRQNLKATLSKKELTYKGEPLRVTIDLSTKTVQERREWRDVV